MTDNTKWAIDRPGHTVLPPAGQSDGTLLEVHDLQVAYASKKGLVPAVRGINFNIGVGEKVAIVGESGSGKSTTAHAIINLLAPQARVTGGSIVLNGRSLLGLPNRAWPRIRGSQVGLVPQDPGSALNPTTRVGTQVAEALQLAARVPKDIAWTQAVTLLGDVGLDRPELRAKQFPHELSGGMRQRVLVAIAIAGRPALIIADEPTSALDVSVQRTILDLLDHVAEQNNSAVLLITHDLGVAAERADRLVVMHGGQIAEQGITQSVLDHPQTPYTRKLLAAAPTLEVAAAPAVVDPVAPGQQRKETGQLAAGIGNGRPPKLEQPAALTVTNLSKRFNLGGAKPAGLNRKGAQEFVQAVDNVSLSIAPGTTFALVGESGSGKSTFTRLLVGLTKPDHGVVTFAGTDVTARTGNGPALTHLRSQTGLVYQNPYASLNPRLTVGQIIAEPLLAGRFARTGSTQHLSRVAELLTRVQLDPEFAQRRPGSLSGGQRQRVAIARALAQNPKLLILDEPTSALDVSVQKQILDLLDNLQQRHGLTYLFITHDLAVVAQIADRVGVMQAGRLVEEGPTRQVFTAPSSPYTKHLLAAVPGQSRQRANLVG